MDPAALVRARERARQSLASAYARLERDDGRERPNSPAVEQSELLVRAAMDCVSRELLGTEVPSLDCAVDTLDRELASLDAVLEAEATDEAGA